MKNETEYPEIILDLELMMKQSALHSAQLSFFVDLVKDGIVFNDQEVCGYILVNNILNSNGRISS